MDEKLYKAQRKRPWILVPMREQLILAIVLYVVPIVIALVLTALLGL